MKINEGATYATTIVQKEQTANLVNGEFGERRVQGTASLGTAS